MAPTFTLPATWPAGQPFPATGEPTCWCGMIHRGAMPPDLAERGHEMPDDTRNRAPSSTVTGADGACMVVYRPEIVTAADGRTYTQRRGYIAAATDHGGAGRLLFTPSRHHPSGWCLTWADAGGWILAAMAAQRGWLDRLAYGADTYGHTEYMLP